MITTSHRGKNPAKGRRNPGACDICRRRKIKCDSGERMGRTCTHCIMAGLECTHHESTKSLGHAKGYITNLETRLEKMEKILNKLYPGIDLSTELDRLADMPEVREGRASSVSHGLMRNEEEEEENVDWVITGKLQKMGMENRFYGGSSSFRLIKTALGLKGQYIGKTLHNVANTFKPRKREEFWVSHPWQRGKLDEELNINISTPEYPDNDLLTSLIDLYFQEFNIIFPLLHRPTFERQIAEGLHTRNLMFGNVVLLVCALGAKYSNDPRVFTEGSNTTRSAGHKWYAQVDSYQKAYVVKPTLHELHMITLLLLFEKSTGNTHTSYVRAGWGLRLTQDVGAHRRKLRKDGRTTKEDELWKRVFWILFAYDRFSSAAFGRPCTIHRDDYDQDFPIECDDEYWELPDPSKSFQQPPDKPSTISYFNCFLRLMEIYSEAVRVLCSIRKSTSVLDQAVANLDSDMNKWIDCVPEHLRWDPNRKNMLFLKQSAALYTTYYGVQIFIHRPFMTVYHNPSTLTPSLAICTNAARSSCYVADVLNRLKIMPPSLVQSMCSTAAFILLVNLWGSKRSGNPRRELDLVQKVLDMLNICEQRWTCAGRTRDIITELSSLSDADGSTSEIVNISKAEQDSGISSSSNGLYGSVYPKELTVRPQEVPLQSNYALPLNRNALGQEPAHEPVLTGKALNNESLKSDLVGGDNEAFPLRETGSESLYGYNTIGDQGMGVPADTPEVQNDRPMDEIWQMMSIDDMTGWFLSTNVYEWESYFMNVDQQQELINSRYA